MSQPAKYRKKPVVIEAMQLTATNVEAATDWIAESQGAASGVMGPKPHVYIDTLEGIMTASVGDWIIRGVEGEFYPCKPDIFDATYEALPPVHRLARAFAPSRALTSQDPEGG